MIQELQTERLDINNKYEVFTTCKQGDNLKLKIIVYDKSLPADLSNYTCRLRAFKRDQMPLIQNTGITITNNIVYIEGDEQLTTTAGIVKAELQFVHKTTLQKKSSFYIIFNVISSVFNVDGAVSTPTCTLLKQLENDLDRVENIGYVLEDAKDTRDDLIVKTDAANTSNENLVNSTSTADTTKNALDTLNTNANTTKLALDTANTTAVTNKNNLDVANVQAVKNYEALEQLGDATDLAKKVEAQGSQLNENVKDIENVKTNINNLDSSKVEKVELQKESTYIKQEIDTERKRIDNLVKPESSTDNTETTDIRVGADGTTYDSAGTAVRQQFNKLNYVLEEISPNYYPKNITGDLVFEEGYYDPIQNKAVSSTDYKHAVIRATKGDIFIINGKSCWVGRLYSLVKNGTTLSYFPSDGNNIQYWGEKLEIKESCDLYFNIEVASYNDVILYKMSKSSNIEIKDGIESINIINNEKWNSGQLRTNYGSSLSTKEGNFKYINYVVECKDGDIVSAKYRYYSLMFYDEYFRLIEQFITTPNCSKAVPEGTKYVGIYVGNDDKQEDQIITINNSIPSYFVPYGINLLKSESQMRRGVKWVAFGDSLTDKATLSKDEGTKNYVDFVSESLGLITTNCGKGGTGYIANNGGYGQPFVDRISTIPLDTDVITIFGSFNDLYCNTPIGTIEDNAGTSTLYGKFKEFIEALFNRCPDAIIGIITPTPWEKACRANTSGEKHFESIAYINALIEIAKYYSLPLLNLYDESGLRPWILDFKTKYYHNSDGVHPNQDGHKKYITQKVLNFIKTLITYC